jgi:acyl-CoA synthetase (AMP-forming)/AMP-acid ligase II
VCAVVVPKDGATVQTYEIVGFVQERLASYKKPKYVVVKGELPRNSSGKVLKTELREELRHIEQREDAG